ncbi:hypothetical protein [Marinospirillum sp.]|uniref:hypothetical protein n=1 Tax=Marinospirillum sp. TaxID=2183934 RepID=UPI00287015B3|nr:hypothetical protein [Marinospirillum sp.]MDR9469156.1 hypothetical protein [Marinospirillum sp.]
MTGERDLQQLSLPLVLLHQGRQTLALESRWVLGCHAFRSSEAATGVVDAARLWPQPPTPSQQQLMTLKTPSGGWYLRFHGEVEFVELPATQLHALPELMQARKTWPAVKALVEYQGQLLVLLDALSLEQQALAVS